MNEPKNLHCIVCEKQSVKPCFLKSTLSYWKCQACGLIQLHLVPGRKELADAYDAGYFKGWGMETADSDEVGAMKRKSFQHLFNIIDRFRTPGVLLDVGCAAGHLLEEAQQRGWSAYGVELSPYAARIARKKFGDRVITGRFEDTPWQEKFFDVIVMSDVLEHFTDPDSAMRKARSILKPGGILAIVTPDTESLSAKWLSARWSHYQKDHLFYFNRYNLVSYLSKWSFTVVNMGGHKKFFNLAYLYLQADSYHHRLLMTCISTVNRLTFNTFRKIHFSLSTGDMLMIARLNQEQKGTIGGNNP